MTKTRNIQELWTGTVIKVIMIRYPTPIRSERKERQNRVWVSPSSI
jgi:hypothetical protein